MYNLLLYKVYIYFIKLELQLLNKQNHSTDKGEKFCPYRAFFGCIDKILHRTVVVQLLKSNYKALQIWSSSVGQGPSFKSEIKLDLFSNKYKRVDADLAPYMSGRPAMEVKTTTTVTAMATQTVSIPSRLAAQPRTAKFPGTPRPARQR